VTRGNLKRALSAQVVYGGRIGTNLVERGWCNIDKLAWTLGQQHGVPVAGEEQLAQVPRQTLTIMPGTICARYSILPLRYERAHIHLAMLDPHRLDLIDEVGSILGIPVIHPYAAPELRLHHYLEVHYEVPRPKRFLRAPGDPIEHERRSFLTPSVSLPALSPTGPRASQELLQMVFGPESQKSRKSDDLIISLEGFEERPPTLDSLVDALEKAPDRDTLIERLLQPLLPEVDLSVLFVIRGTAAMAVGAWGTMVSQEHVRNIVVPVSGSDLLEWVVSQRVPLRGDAKSDPIQQTLSAFLGKPAPGEVCLVPICVDDQLVNVLWLQTRQAFAGQALPQLCRLASAAAAAYRRLMLREPEPTPSGPLRLRPEKPVAIQVGSTEEIETIEAFARVARELTLLPRQQRPFGRYALICRLASGGMANLYLARLAGREGFTKEVAIKRIHEHLSDQAEFIQMFIDEARLAARISHPNVVQVIELDCVDASFYIAMEYVDGESLHAILRRCRPDPVLAARIIANAAAGLHAAHELRSPDGEPLGVVHRDVSPQNILISYQGAVKVVDFGIARARGNLHTTEANSRKGKVAYMSPEQVMADPLDCRADVFALGIVLYEITTYRRLFKAENEAGTMIKVVRGDVPPPSSVCPGYPPDLEAIVIKALDRDPDRRHQSAEALQADLERYIIGSKTLVLASLLAELLQTTFSDRIAEKRRVQEEFERELAMS